MVTQREDRRRMGSPGEISSRWVQDGSRLIELNSAGIYIDIDGTSEEAQLRVSISVG